MPEIHSKHPLAIRWFHWLNFPILGVMIWSGLLIYWANDIYAVSFGNWILFPFFPDSIWKSLNIPHRLAEGMAYHFFFMWLFFINGLLYVIYTVLSGEWRFLVPQRGTLKHAWATLKHDLHLSKFVPEPRKFNGAQQIAYTSVIIMGIGSLLTGLAIYKPVQLSWLCAVLGGYEAARAEHFILTIGYVLFFLLHIFQVIRAGWNNFRAMLTGYEVISK